MTSERYQKLKSVFHSALEVAPSKRAEFLDEVCGNNKTLRHGVERLLENYESGFMKDSAFRKAVEEALGSSFAEGEQLGRYEIIKRLGKGGMGEVYLAHDKSLGRDVAIKALLPEFTADDERISRFKFEAKAASALNHPNIITIYEIREDGNGIFIVTEYIKGETLAEILESERLSVEKTLDLAIQIADALDEAHTAGIIHRDIKPSNIIVGSKGQVKVLDFGLAKIITENGKREEDEKVRNEVEENLPTETISPLLAFSSSPLLTSPGAVMGTVPFMSPEQLRGKTLDTRTDVFSFGALFYEMLTGLSPFRRDSSAEVISAILNDEPNWINLPPELKPIIQKCLKKDKEKRYAAAGDILKDLRRVRENPPKTIKTESEIIGDLTTVRLLNVPTNAETEVVAGRKKHFVFNWLWAAAGTIVLGIAGVSLWYFLKPPPDLPKNLTISQFVNWKRDLSEVFENTARFSPDGKLVAYTATKNGVNAIWLKQIGGGEPFTRKQDKWDDRNPLFSPDGQQIAFISEREGQIGIWTMPTLGGAAMLVKTLENKWQRLILWSKDGTRIYFEKGKNLFEIDLQTKEIKQLTDLDAWEFAELHSDISPDETQIAFVSKKDGQSDIWTIPKSGGEAKRITDDEFEEANVVWHADGKRLIYDSVRNGISQIFAVGTDDKKIVQLISSDNTTYVSDASRDGKQIIYYSQRDESDIWRVSLEDGKETRLSDSISVETWVNSSPDGKSFVFQAEKAVDVSRRIVNSRLFLQLNEEGAEPLQIADDGYLPIWSPNGKSVAFLRSEVNFINLWTVSVSGGEAKSLTTEGVTFAGYSLLPFNRVAMQDYQWSPDGSRIIYCARRGNISNLWQTATDGSGEKRLTENTNPQMWFLSPAISADGQRIAFIVMTMPSAEQKRTKWSVWVTEAGQAKMLFESEKIMDIVGWSETDREIIAKTSESGKAASSPTENIEIFQISPDTGEKRPLLELADAYLKNIALSPDKKTLGYVGRKDGLDVIRTISLKTRADRVFVQSNDSRIYFGSINWSGDNKSIYFGKQLRWQMISLIENYK
ncbi:MAG TPA: protein kinase [Pyrinomonadaceae bacterium]|nr:protein kinase [Pyrinomonadaceae bacterium]